MIAVISFEQMAEKRQRQLEERERLAREDQLLEKKIAETEQIYFNSEQKNKNKLVRRKIVG